MVAHRGSVIVSLLGIVALGLLLFGVVGHAAAARHHRQIVLSRPLEKGGCCNLRLTDPNSASASATDSETHFSATAGSFLLSGGHVPGYAILWAYITERNLDNVALTLRSGPDNWLLVGKDRAETTFSAVAGVPPHRTGMPLFRQDSLSADTNPENAGWISFRIPVRTLKHYILLWRDCMPGCATRPVDQGYSALVDLTIVPVLRKNGNLI